MKTAVRRVLLMSALLSPTAPYALGLGEIRLNSALNQPFDAEIELVSAADEDLAALRASLASNDAFARYGLDRPSYLADFSFRVVRGSDGQDVLRITSPRPVSEPFVTLLVEATWPRGRLLREYTVLLDPPVFAPGPQAAEAPVATPHSTAPAPAVRRTEPAAPAPAPGEPVERPAAVAAATIEPGSSYRVQRNDTLWKIASAASPGTRSDVNRAMVAIYQSNPAAFDGNINILKAGSLLSIPSAAEMSSISASAAAAEVSRQYRQWREGSAAAGESAEGGRLRLVTPEQGTPAASTATVQPAPSAGAPSADLQGRVQQLEAELAEARRLLEVRNAELATLQGAAPVAEPAAEPAAEVPVEPGTAEPVAEEAPPAPVEEAPAAAAEPPAAPVEEGPTLLERLAGYWWVLLGLLAAALAFVLYRRSRGESGAAEEDLAEALA
ncbi:MAG: FimV/HubP family polar landmark protein, partial [Steroidobacteraceae bacterium]